MKKEGGAAGSILGGGSSNKEESCSWGLFNSSVQVLRVEGSVFRYHGTLRAGGVGAEAGAAGFSRRKEPVGFLERLTRQEVALRKSSDRASAVSVFKGLWKVCSLVLRF